jgi:predicted RNase H-like HicB family nuclease
MKSTHLLVAFALAASCGAALAHDLSTVAAQGKTRAQVLEELKQARADGSLYVGDAEYPKLPFVPTKTRAQVLEELKQARADGSLDVGDAEYPKLPFVSTKTRAQVREELAAYQKSHDPDLLHQGH